MTVSKRARLIAPFAILAVLAGLVAASQELAAAFHYPREFGGGLLDLGRMRIYPPWAILGWYGRYAGVYPKAFDQASLWGLLAAFLPIMVAIGVTRRIRRLLDELAAIAGPDRRPELEIYRLRVADGQWDTN